MSVLFASQCYRKDWQPLAAGRFARKMTEIGYPFSGAMMGVKSVDDKEQALSAFEAAGYDAVDIEAFFPTVLSSLSMPRGRLANYDTGYDGYDYAAGPLSAVVWAHGQGYEYLCYHQGDVVSQGDWITPALKVLGSEPSTLVVSPLSETNTWHNHEGYDHYMSDHCFLVRVSDFMRPETYAVKGTDTDYPAYGGNNFEHMVGKYLKKTGKNRKILSDYHYLHPAI